MLEKILNKNYLPTSPAPKQLDIMVLSFLPKQSLIKRYKKVLVFITIIFAILVIISLILIKTSHQNISTSDNQIAQEQIEDTIKEIDNVMILAQEEDELKIDQINDF